MQGTRGWLRTTVAATLLSGLVSALSPAQPDRRTPTTQPAASGRTDELDSLRLLGKAHYENGDFKPAADAFRRCIALAPESAADRCNLALALLRARQYEEALRRLKDAERLEPELLPVHYLFGIIHKRREEHAQAIARLEHVLARDPACLGAHYNVGVCYKYVDQYENARAAFEAAVRVSPEHPSSHYQLITVCRRLGRMEDARRELEIYNRIKDRIDESQKTVEALERSRYSDILTLPPHGQGLAAATEISAHFVDATAESGLPEPRKPAPPRSPEPAPPTSLTPAMLRDRHVPEVGGAVALADDDADGDLDIYVVNCAADAKASANRLYRNQGGARGPGFTDRTDAAGVGDAGLGLDAAFGDYDNDGHLDLYVVNCGPNALYRNRGDGTYEDVSTSSRTNEPQFGRRGVWVDYDHDNDLDMLIGNDVDFVSPNEPLGNTPRVPQSFSGQINTLLRNNGGSGAPGFSDQTDEAGLLVDVAQTRDIVFADFDGDYDTDLLVVNADAPSVLFINTRMGKFDTGGSFAPPLERGAVAAAEVDFNRDGRPDLVVAVGTNLYLYTNDRNGVFTGRPVSLPSAIASVERIGVVDFNNDGWSDLLLSGPEAAISTGGTVKRRAPRTGAARAGSMIARDVSGAATQFAEPGSARQESARAERALALLAATGPGRFRDVTSVTGLDTLVGDVADFAAGDLDGDGDEDLVLATRDRGVVLLRNDGGDRAHWLDVRLVGKKVNRCGYAATVEVAVGGHYQNQTMRDGRLHFGLGDLEGVDIVRVTWPNGVAQNVIRPKINAPLKIEESMKVSASCGFLYAYDGKRFGLINEILGVGPLGVPVAPGVYHQPDCTELTKIGANQLVARDGVYELRLTEELRETMYADMITLRVVDHPAGLEIIPNEMFTAPPFPEDKLFAVGDHRPPRSAVDDRGADVSSHILERDGRFPTFPLTSYEGLAEPHSLTIDLGDLAGAERIMLFLDGWIYWPESSTVMAVAQDPRFEFVPLALEVRDAGGRWRTAIESVGLPTSKGAVIPVDLTGRFLGNDYRVRLSTNMCVYFERIFVSTRDRADECRVTDLPVFHANLHRRGFSRMMRDEPGYERFDYAQVSPTGSWNQARGRYTRYGAVTELLAQPDNRYVIFGPGDEMALRFVADSLPPLAAGWVRDFIFYANGWVKDGDLNTKHSATVTPLPFHGMSGYPYPAAEKYPDTPELRRYHETYNTREAQITVGQLRSLAPCRGLRITDR